jgi:hypothetical protein
MVGIHRSGLIPCVLVVTVAMLEFSLGICLLKELDHVVLGRLYLAIGLVTLLGLASLLEERYHH